MEKMKQKTMDTLLKKKIPKLPNKSKLSKTLKKILQKYLILPTPLASPSPSPQATPSPWPPQWAAPLLPSLCAPCATIRRSTTAPRQGSLSVALLATKTTSPGQQCQLERYQYYQCQLLVCISMHKKCVNCNIYMFWQIIAVLHLVDFILFKTIFNKRKKCIVVVVVICFTLTASA